MLSIVNSPDLKNYIPYTYMSIALKVGCHNRDGSIHIETECLAGLLLLSLAVL